MPIDMEMAEKIKARVREYRAKLEAMSRPRLLDEFRSTGNEPHPRFSKEWMLTALTRLYQDALWCAEAGCVPKEIAEADSKFWLSNTVSLMRRDAMVYERREERRIERAQTEEQKPGVAPVSVPCTELKMVFVKGKENPFSASDRVEAPLHRLFEKLKKRREMDYAEVKRWCARDIAKPTVAVIYLGMQRATACDFSVIERETEPVEEPNVHPWTNRTEESPVEPTPAIPDVEQPYWRGIDDPSPSMDDDERAQEESEMPDPGEEDQQG